MREIDRLTVERCGIPYPTLMETAGARVVEAIIEHGEPIGKSVFSVFCGKGNNGGDGAVAARLLWMRGAPLVCVYLFGRIAETKGEARINFEIISQIHEEERKRVNFFPRLSIQNPIGSGDAIAAGFSCHRLRHHSFLDCIRFGIACGCANGLTLLAGHIRKKDIEPILPDVQIERFSQ